MRRLIGLGAAAVVAVVLFMGVPAYAGGYPGPTQPVSGRTSPIQPVSGRPTTPSTPTTARVGVASTSGTTSTSSLAFTGVQIGMMVGGGLLLLVAGTGLVLVTRQRRSRTI